MYDQIIYQDENKIILNVRVSPGARRSGIQDVWNNTAIKIALRAPAVEGKANAALISFLSDFFQIRKSAITIVSGELNRNKKVCILFSSSPEAQQKKETFLQQLS